MTFREVCDLAYLLLLEKSEAMCLMQMQAALIAGPDENGNMAQVPDLVDTRARLDAMLVAPFPKPERATVEEAEMQELRRAVGLA